MFKYMSVDVAPQFAKTVKVRFTQPSGLNDPFELRPLIDFDATAAESRALTTETLSKEFGSLDLILDRAERTAHDDPNAALFIEAFRIAALNDPALAQALIAKSQEFITKVVSGLITDGLWRAQWERFQQGLGQSVGIFSLTEDPVHTLMWSHYASQHGGIVAEFDEMHPWFDQRATADDEFRHLVRVVYVESPQPRSWNQIDGTCLLYTKMVEWAYEREWRIIRPLSEGTEVSPSIYCFDVPPSAIRSIIFGFRTTLTLEQEVRAAIEADPALSHVRFKRAKLGSGKIEVVEDSTQKAV